MKTPHNESAIEKLTSWFAAECNGDWEHLYGITIETSDNPGWIVQIDLWETDLAGHGSLEKHYTMDKNNWINILISDEKFDGSCSLGKLNELISEFIFFSSNKKLSDTD